MLFMNELYSHELSMSTAKSEYSYGEGGRAGSFEMLTESGI